MPENPAFAQTTYQVRFEWGAEGLGRLEPADIVVLVDVLGVSAAAIAAAETGEAPDAVADEALLDAAGAAEVVAGGLRNAAAVARHVLDRQGENARRTSVAIIAAGARDAGGVRVAVEDLIGAGAVIAALGDLGIDHCSPEAAVAGEGFRALRGAARHLLTASGTGRELDAAGRKDEVLTAAAVDAASVVPVLRAAV